MHAIVDPNYEIGFPDIAEKDLQDVLKVTVPFDLNNGNFFTYSIFSKTE